MQPAPIRCVHHNVCGQARIDVFLFLLGVSSCRREEGGQQWAFSQHRSGACITTSVAISLCGQARVVVFLMLPGVSPWVLNGIWAVAC